MSETTQSGERRHQLHRLPPFLVIRDFLSDEDAATLLAFAIAHRDDFAPSRVGRNQVVNPAIRDSTIYRGTGDFRRVFEEKVLLRVPELTERLRMSPVTAQKLELALVAHGDGAHYARHIDSQVALAQEVKSMRVLSGVYYFHRLPKGFSGGALRLHSIGPEGDGELHEDVAPEHNALVLFPSWAPHEVMRVTCPSGKFEDSRFAVNCWVRREMPVAPS